MSGKVFENLVFFENDILINQNDDLFTFSLEENGFLFSLSVIKKNGIVYVVDEKKTKLNNQLK